MKNNFYWINKIAWNCKTVELKTNCSNGGSYLWEEMWLLCASIWVEWLQWGSRGLFNITHEFQNGLFSTIFYLIAIKFDVQSLRLYIVQSFCNEITSGDHNALHCLHQHMGPSAIHNTTIVDYCQGYAVNMEMPYERGRIEDINNFQCKYPNLVLPC